MKPNEEMEAENNQKKNDRGNWKNKSMLQLFLVTDVKSISKSLVRAKSLAVDIFEKMM